MAYYLDFIKLQYVLLTFSFTFGPFESLPQNFGLFQNGSKFWNFRLPKVEKVNIAHTYSLACPGASLEWSTIIGFTLVGSSLACTF
jgi:hypothetical protein